MRICKIFWKIVITSFTWFFLCKCCQVDLHRRMKLRLLMPLHLFVGIMSSVILFCFWPLFFFNCCIPIRPGKFLANYFWHFFSHSCQIIHCLEWEDGHISVESFLACKWKQLVLCQFFFIFFLWYEIFYSWHSHTFPVLS